jgi:hypothetical protein
MNKILLLIFSLLAVYAFAQTPPAKLRLNGRTDTSRMPPKDQHAVEVEDIFAELERSIASGSVRTMVGMLSQQVYLDIAGGERGYFSSNQATSLLLSFFAQRKPLSFSFSSFNHRPPTPYATGRLTYLHKGSRESVQVYVVLTRLNATWVVSHFNIY